MQHVVTKTSEMPRTGGLLAGCLAAVAILAMASVATAANYKPTRTDDPAPDGCKPNDCSLREAVIASNAGYPLPSTITLRPGKRYELTRPGLGEDAAVTGDLDLTASLGVRTKGFVRAKSGHPGAKPAVIDGNDLDRIFDVHGPGLKLNWVVARDGHARLGAGDDGNGGAIRGASIFLGDYSGLVSNVAAGNGGAYAVTLSPAAPASSTILRMALLKGNSAAGNGGALYMDGPPGRSLSIDGVRATGNSAGGSGGAFFGTGLAIRYSTVANNRSGSEGGGIALSGPGSSGAVLWSTVSGNRAALSGGGIHTTARGSEAVPGDRGLFVEDSTIASNRAGGNGGGIAASGGSSTSGLSGDTIARNAAGAGQRGGGLYQGNGDTIDVQNTILALNLAGAGGPDCFGESNGLASQGHNLIGKAGGCFGFGAAGDLFGARLALGKLANNGGAPHWTYGRPLKTIALGRGSKAIDRALHISGMDNRGVARGTKQDIGAYERVGKRYRLVTRPHPIRCTRTDPICAK